MKIMKKGFIILALFLGSSAMLWLPVLKDKAVKDKAVIRSFKPYTPISHTPVVTPIVTPTNTELQLSELPTALVTE